MPITDLTLWLLIALAEAVVVYLFLLHKLLRQLFFLNFYFVLTIANDIGRFAVLSKFGIDSSAYMYFYCFGEAVLVTSQFLSICELTIHLVGSRLPRKRIMLSSAGAFLAAVCFALWEATLVGFSVATRFYFELSQCVFFVSGVALLFLWVWRFRSDSGDRLAAQFVNVLSVYFLVFFLIGELLKLAPPSTDVGGIAPILAAWLPLGCGFALVSHEAP